MLKDSLFFGTGFEIVELELVPILFMELSFSCSSLVFFSNSSIDFLSSIFSFDESTESLSFLIFFSKDSISSSKFLILSFCLSLNLSLSLSSLLRLSTFSFNSLDSLSILSKSFLTISVCVDESFLVSSV